MIKFEVGRKYTGSGMTGSCEMTVLKRTLKMIRFKTVLGTFNAKIRDYYLDRDSVGHQAWLYTA
tara:strand:- start:443 stop:634 length:192 start_codon:yes stop_codon:yes gene_type:complete